jgi:hypothetical protein
LFFAHFVILFSLKKLSGAPLTETRVSGRNCDSPPRSSGRLQLLFCVTAERAQKKAASLTRDRFTTSKAIQEQQTHRKNNIGRRGKAREFLGNRSYKSQSRQPWLWFRIPVAWRGRGEPAYKTFAARSLRQCSVERL